MRPLVRSYGVSSTSTSSPVSTRMRFLRILPAVWPRISWPFSRRTRNIALGSSSTTVPRISSSSSLAKRSLFVRGKKSRSLPLRSRERKGGPLSDRQDGRAGRAPALKGAMRLRRLGERKTLLDLDLDLAAADDVEQFGGTLLELRAAGDIMVERRPGQVE